MCHFVVMFTFSSIFLLLFYSAFEAHATLCLWCVVNSADVTAMLVVVPVKNSRWQCDQKYTLCGSVFSPSRHLMNFMANSEHLPVLC